MSSCLIRNDYNVLFSFLILVILNKFYRENSKLFSKILIHLLICLVLLDVIWLIIIMPHWRSKPKVQNLFWESLSGLHFFTLILAFLELFVKTILAGLIFWEYRATYPNDMSELFNFSYSEPNSISKVY